jgi:hypothetical protein
VNGPQAASGARGITQRTVPLSRGMRPSSDRTARGRVRYPDQVPCDSFEEHAWAVHADLLDTSEAASHRELGLARLRSAACRSRRSAEADRHRLSGGIATYAEWCSRVVGQCHRDCHSSGVTGDNTRQLTVTIATGRLSDELRERGCSLGPWKVRPGGHWLQLADSRRTAGPAPRGRRSPRLSLALPNLPTHGAVIHRSV